MLLCRFYVVSQPFFTLLASDHDRATVFPLTVISKCRKWHLRGYPGYQRFFLACDEELCRPQADSSFAEGQRHKQQSHEKKPLPQSALIYHAGWTLTLSLICQSNRRVQANSKVITNGGTTCSSPKYHIIYRITSLSFNRNHCLKSNLVTVQFSLIYVALGCVPFSQRNFFRI